MKLSDVKIGLALTGLEPEKVCTVLAATFLAEGALQVVYSLPDGTVKVRLLGSGEESALSVAEADRPLTFEGDPGSF